MVILMVLGSTMDENRTEETETVKIKLEWQFLFCVDNLMPNDNDTDNKLREYYCKTNGEHREFSLFENRALCKISREFWELLEIRELNRRYKKTDGKKEGSGKNTVRREEE